MRKKPTDLLQDMEQVLYSIRPYLIASLNDEMLINYKEEFIIKHGMSPTSDQLNQIFQISVQKQSCAIKADIIIEEIIKKLKKELRRKYMLELSLNITFNIMVITACLSYFFLYLGHKILPNLNVDVFYIPIFFINAIIIALVMLIKLFRDIFVKT